VSLDIWDKTPTQADALAQAQRCTWTARNLYASAGRGGPCLPPTARMVTAMEFWQGTTVRTAYRQVSPMSSPRPVPISDRTRSSRFTIVEVEQSTESLASPTYEIRLVFCRSCFGTGATSAASATCWRCSCASRVPNAKTTECACGTRGGQPSSLEHNQGVRRGYVHPLVARDERLVSAQTMPPVSPSESGT
jgi:hypothetical protein